MAIDSNVSIMTGSVEWTEIENHILSQLIRGKQEIKYIKYKRGETTNCLDSLLLGEYPGLHPLPNYFLDKSF